VLLSPGEQRPRHDAAEQRLDEQQAPGLPILRESRILQPYDREQNAAARLTRIAISVTGGMVATASLIRR